MVAMALVKEMTYLSITVIGGIVAVSLIVHGDASSFEKLGAVIIPAIVSALAKGQPPGGSASGLGALGMLFLLAFRRH